MSCLKIRSTYSCCFGFQPSMRAREIPADVSRGSSSLARQSYWSATSRLVRRPISASCCAVLNPSAPTDPLPVSSNCCNPPTRTMKNSSRFELLMARNFIRSRSAADSSRASSSTRALNSSQLSSRFNKGSLFLLMRQTPRRRERAEQCHLDPEYLLEEVALLLQRQLLQGQVRRIVHPYHEGALLARETYVADLLRVLAFERIRHAQDGRQFRYGQAVVPSQRGVFHMIRPRRGPPMVASHQGDERRVFFRQTEQIAVLDDVHRVFVMAAVADERPHLVQQGRDSQQQLEPLLQPVFRLQLPKQTHAQVGHVQRM